jgi:hypothetical protein
VSEAAVGSELEIDHFQPKSAGGSDELENLVYCCTSCNRRKGTFWPIVDAATTPRRLLHPGRDDIAPHLREEENGWLTALTETGAFHIERLALNRPRLVALRVDWQAERRREQIAREKGARQEFLRKEIVATAQRIQRLVDEINQMLNR